MSQDGVERCAEADARNAPAVRWVTNMIAVGQGGREE
jgi:hypothetical protein